ncbi:plasmid replication protein RepC [Acidiphilium iwatense]|uniref:Replication protein C n=1 Tax=Acidiphilium iwatense TaxID=768198 RepID=A0ABS9E3N1_9PROT|nr:plasmid replication protein RepC [Acidiphilium iwatense]MCF3948267.1 replication protein C [Acidiphilium iwatense]
MDVPTGGQSDRQPTSSSPPIGLRRITPAMLPADRLAERFAGGDITPGQALAALKSASPRLGISPRAIHALDWLFRFTQPQDWQPGARPIVWPSAAMQAAELGLTETHVKRLNRHLVELGLIAMRDSPNGKRYGRRNARGRIIEAYGFDLSPIAVRIEEFRAAAEAHRAERAAVAQLRRRATIARNSLRQTWQTYQERQIADPALSGLKLAASAASQALRGLDTAVALTTAVAGLETIAGTARQALEISLAASTNASSDTVEMCPKGHQNVPHITPTNQNANPSDTVMALEECSLVQDYGIPDEGNGRAKTGSGKRTTEARQDRGSIMKIRPDELVRIAPRLKPYLRRASPSWPEIVDAADWLRHDLGISKPLWGDACVAMGREQAAIAVAIVSAKPVEHFRSTPGGYFHGMVAKARAGNLNLSRTIWGMRAGSPDYPMNPRIPN